MSELATAMLYLYLCKKSGMAVIKTQKKITGRPRKVTAKKAKYKKSSLEAIERAMAIADKYKLDLNYINE
jgi:hypothetical protein